MTPAAPSGDGPGMPHDTDDPAPGVRRHWLVTAAQTDGRLERAEWWLPPGAGHRAEHVHPAEERLELLAGAVTGSLRGAAFVLVRGQGAVLPAGAAHAWWNGGAVTAHVVVEHRFP